MGRKKQSHALAVVHGTRMRGAQTETAPTQPVVRPDGLAEGVIAVWDELAGHAISQNTLVPQTVRAFVDLCEARVRMGKWQARIEAEGETFVKVTVDGSGQEHSELKAHPLISRLHGLSQRVEMGMVKFRLGPIGKEIVAAAKPDDPFSEFDSEARSH